MYRHGTAASPEAAASHSPLSSDAAAALTKTLISHVLTMSAVPYLAAALPVYQLVAKLATETRGPDKAQVLAEHTAQAVLQVRLPRCC